MTDSTTETIRELNDKARKALGSDGGCQVLITRGIQALNPVYILERVRDFTDFNADNDPYEQHDFGAFDYEGDRVYFKFDYYDLDMEFGSEHPEDPTQTKRVLTVMLAEEY